MILGSIFYREVKPSKLKGVSCGWSGYAARNPAGEDWYVCLLLAGTKGQVHRGKDVRLRRKSGGNEMLRESDYPGTYCGMSLFLCFLHLDTFSLGPVGLSYNIRFVFVCCTKPIQNFSKNVKVVRALHFQAIRACVDSLLVK